MINELKNTFRSIVRADYMEDRVSELKDRNTEMKQVKEERKPGYKEK